MRRAAGEGESSETELRRRAVAEANGRRVNEAIERGIERAGAAVFVCECGCLGCNTTVRLTLAAYEAVRTSFDRFLVVPGHEIEALEEVVERHPEYLVVVKDEGTPKRIARASDQRVG